MRAPRTSCSRQKILRRSIASRRLAPLIRAEIWRALEILKAGGQAILVIDKNVEVLTRIASRHYVLEKGQIVWSGNSAELRGNVELQHRYLGV